MQGIQGLLGTQGTSISYNYTTVYSGTTPGLQTITTPNAKIVGGYIIVTDNSMVTAGDTKTFSYSLPPNFLYPPIVSASVVNYGTTAAGQNVVLTITSVTTSSIVGVLKCNTSGNVSLAVNFVIIGIPV